MHNSYLRLSRTTLLLAVACGDDTSPGVGTDASTSTSPGTSSSSTTEAPPLDDSSGSSGSGSTTSTTGPMPCTSDEDCTDPGASFCGMTGECVACNATADGDAACAGLDTSQPLCVGGACVACTAKNVAVCEAQLLLCDQPTHACVSCNEHGQCPSGACQIAAGTCFAPTLVVHVDGDPGAIPAPDYTSIAAAVADVAAGDARIIIVHQLVGQSSYQTAGMGLRIDGDKLIALLAAPGERPILQGTGANPGLRVEGAATAVYVEGLTVSQATARGVVVDDALLWIDRSRIVQNGGGGVLAQNGAELTLRNAFVGQSLSGLVGLEVDASTATVLYSTITSSTFGMTAALGCTNPLAVDIRNSIVVSQGGIPPNEIACPAATITFSATEGVLAGDGNVSVGVFPAGMPELWFVDFPTGDFHIQNTGLTDFADVAHWRDGDPSTDIDGDPRPIDDDAPDFAGADAVP